jgi:hypothetical protein
LAYILKVASSHVADAKLLRITHNERMSTASESALPKRCLKCFYILDHLETHICPECGSAFDPANPTTYTAKPPFIWWTFWLPAFLLAGVGGGVTWAVLVMTYGYTAATTLVMPLAIGAVIGYGGKVRIWFKIALALMALGFAIAVLAGTGLAGGFCAAILVACATIPVFLGMLAGRVLRILLASSSFSQRDYLRSWMLQLIIFCIPVMAAMIEGRHPLQMPITVTTTRTINTPPMQAWQGIQFFEEVKRPTPWLLYLSPQLRPLYTIGHSEKVGDLKTCVYQRGKLVKQITEVIPGKRLAFRVVEQDRIETDGAKLLDGSFELEPTDGGSHTRVTLITRYTPLLNPRFAYRWAEALAIHTLHGHVLAGMKDTAEAEPESSTR